MSKLLNRGLLLILIPMVVIGGYLFLKLNNLKNFHDKSTLGASVSIYEGKQMIDITAKAGYSPSFIKASANLDTVLRVTTNSTFDCSSALNIPMLGIRKNLPPTAITEIPIGAQVSGTTLAGTCSMGMYKFNIEFN